jgi:hypothetical protein
LIRLKSIGDIGLTLPAIHTARERFTARKSPFSFPGERVLPGGFRDVNEMIALDRTLYSRGYPKALVLETGLWS